MQNITLPSASLTKAVNQLPTLKQDLFYREYDSQSKSSVTSLILWIFGFHYIYYNKWLVQFLFWLTLGGLGIWWLIDLFRIKKKTNNWNHSLAVNLLNRV